MSELGDVLELINTSNERWQSLRAEGHEWRYTPLHLEAFLRRAANRRLRSVVGGRSGVRGESEESSRQWRLWITQPNRIRAEFVAGDGESVTTVVDGTTWWSWSSSSIVVTNEGRDDVETGIGPGVTLVWPAVILPSMELEIRGRTMRLGRKAYSVLAHPASSAEDANDEAVLSGIGAGAEEYELLVDAERGVLLRSEARLHGLPFLVLEMDDVAFDEYYDAVTYMPPAGETFEMAPVTRSILLEELSAAVGFAIFVPNQAPEDSDIHVSIESAIPRLGVPEYADITYHSMQGAGRGVFLALRESAEPMPAPSEIEWRSVEGLRVGEDHHTDPATIRIRLERLGTHVELSSRDLPLERLLDMSQSLVPLPPAQG